MRQKYLREQDFKLTKYEFFTNMTCAFLVIASSDVMSGRGELERGLLSSFTLREVEVLIMTSKTESNCITTFVNS